VQSRKLGAQSVTMVYRRGSADMGASGHEQAWALANGVHIQHWASPVQVLSENGHVSGLEFERTQMVGGKLQAGGERFVVAADMVLKAIGQTMVAQPLGSALELQSGRIRTDAEGQTSHPKVWAGGDCRAGGRDLTVEAVEHGKVAARAIHATLVAA
jgi:glutamate synthase (NADPH/NADH) small chain